ncbi:hypothetical protein D3C80_2173380 [compost metagenome]
MIFIVIIHQLNFFVALLNQVKGGEQKLAPNAEPLGIFSFVQIFVQLAKLLDVLGPLVLKESD